MLRDHVAGTHAAGNLLPVRQRQIGDVDVSERVLVGQHPDDPQRGARGLEGEGVADLDALLGRRPRDHDLTVVCQARAAADVGVQERTRLNAEQREVDLDARAAARVDQRVAERSRIGDPGPAGPHADRVDVDGTARERRVLRDIRLEDERGHRHPLDPETPSLTRPTDKPLSSTVRNAISVTTNPIRAKRPRANERSRRARNTGLNRRRNLVDSMSTRSDTTSVRHARTSMRSSHRSRFGRRGAVGQAHGTAALCCES